MQLMPVAIQEVQIQHNLSNEVNIFSGRENVKYGVLLFEHYIKTCGGVRSALVCYNGGYAALRRYHDGGLDALSEETRAYVPKVLGLARSLDPMFARILPERRYTYVREAVDSAFDELYGVGAEYEQVVFVSGLYTY